MCKHIHALILCSKNHSPGHHRYSTGAIGPRCFETREVVVSQVARAWLGAYKAEPAVEGGSTAGLISAVYLIMLLWPSSSTRCSGTRVVVLRLCTPRWLSPLDKAI
jgi:hypothetical protein